MDPPLRPLSLHRSPSASGARLQKPDEPITISSPPFVSSGLMDNVAITPCLTGNSTEQHWSTPQNQTQSLTTNFQIELAECIETKVVTTTTTTKRTYPPFSVPQPYTSKNLDAKEYPLAFKSTPLELSNFSYEVDGKVFQVRENEVPYFQLQQSSSRQQELTPTSSHVTPTPGRGKEYHDYDAVTTDSIDRVDAHIGEGAASDGTSLDYSYHPKSPDSIAKIGLRRSGDTFSRRKESHRKKGPLVWPPTSAADSAQAYELGDRTNYANRSSLSFVTSASEHASQAVQDRSSPSLTAAESFLPNAVTTPPIADADLESFEELSQILSRAPASISRPTINIDGIQNASLPSPSLSPTLAAANLQNMGLRALREDDLPLSSERALVSQTSESIDSQKSILSLSDIDNPDSGLAWSMKRIKPDILDARSLLDTFDTFPNAMKTWMMYQLLRRCPRKTLHVVADVVNPALKCDFLGELPAELSLQILSFLDVKDLCRAARVSKRWRDIIDTNETGWKDLLDRSDFAVPPSEIERAIREGWGWQDPSGPEGFEQDLTKRSSSPDGDIVEIVTLPSGQQSVSLRPRSAKRKRSAGVLNTDRSKRRAISQEPGDRLRSGRSKFLGNKSKRSEGPLSASIAAALAVPNPNIGLPSLQKLHLFKSIYRRHHELQKSWSSTEIEPYHFAFPAHPRHVITCLQFDDDKILTGSDDTFIHVYDTKTGRLRKRLEGHEGGVWALQYEGNVLVSGSTDRSVRVWDIDKGICTQVFHGHTSTVRCLQILMPTAVGSTDGESVMIPKKPLIITGSRDSQLRVWKLPEYGDKRYIQTGPSALDSDCPFFIRVLTGHTHSVRAIAAHQDTLVSGSYDSSVRVWRISTGETVQILRGHTSKVYSVVLDHERNRCISGSMDSSVKIWSIELGTCLYTLSGHASLVGLLDLKDDRLVSAAADGHLRIWDPANGLCKATLAAHTGAITCFQHDSSKVISGSDKTLKMWDVKTGTMKKDLLTDLTGVWQVKFDERRCVAAVQRENLTYIEVLDFGASRDGVPRGKRGTRHLQQPSDVDMVIEEEEILT